jgi:hypothetical protein
MFCQHGSWQSLRFQLTLLLALASAKREKDKSEELAALKKKQSKAQEEAKQAAEEARNAKDQALKLQKQEMLEKMQRLQEQMRAPREKDKKSKKDRKSMPKQPDNQPATAGKLPQASTAAAGQPPVAAGGNTMIAPPEVPGSALPANDEPTAAAPQILSEGAEPDVAGSAQVPPATGTHAPVHAESARTGPSEGFQVLQPLPKLPGSVAVLAPPSAADTEQPSPFITQPNTVGTSDTVRTQHLAGQETEVVEEDERGEEDSEDDMHEELVQQQRELEEQMRLMEQQHQKELQADRHREEERLHRLRWEATKELQRVTDMQAVSDSESSYEEYGEEDAHGVLTDIGNTLSSTNDAVSSIQKVIKEQHQEMAKILESTKEESKAELTKTKANYQMKLAVGLLGNLKKEIPPLAQAPGPQAVPHPPQTPAKAPTPQPPREETPPLIKPLGKATSLPSGEAPSTGWVPSMKSRPPRQTSMRFRVMQGPAVLQKEFADQFGGQHRVRTAALPVQPSFAARHEPPSLKFPPKQLRMPSAAMSERPKERLQRPLTARASGARMQHDGSELVCEGPVSLEAPQRSRPDTARARMQHDGSELVCEGSVGLEAPQRSRPDTARQVYNGLFQGQCNVAQSRRPLSARMPRQNVQGGAFNSESQEALTQLYIRNITELRPGQEPSPILHISQFNPRGDLKGSLAPGSRRRSSAPAKRPPTSRNTASERERAIGGQLASSPAPTRWATTGQDAKADQMLVSIARMEIRQPTPRKTSSPKNL